MFSAQNSVKNLLFYKIFSRTIIINLEEMIKFILFVSLIVLCLTDCPLNHYPRQTVTGYVQAQIDNAPALHNSYNQYIYTLSDPFAPNAISVAISVIGLEFNPKGTVDFDAQHLPTTTYDQLKFRAKLNDQNYGWKYIKFSFIATQNSLFSLNIQQGIQRFSTGTTPGSYSIYRPLPEFDKVKVQPSIRVYLSGITGTQLAQDTQQIRAMENQLESMKRFNGNPRFIKLIEQSLQIRKGLEFKIQDVKILGRILGFGITTNMDLKSLSFSYVLFSNKALRQNHNSLIGDFSLVDANKHKFTALNNMGMIFAGLNQFSMPSSSNFFFHLAFQEVLGQGYFEVMSNRPYFQLGFSFVAFQMKRSEVCKDCPDSPIIFQERFCVNACPRGFSKTKRLQNFICDKCEIEKLKVVDSFTGECVCAKRHYIDLAEDICKPCSYDCYTCSTANKCLTCDNDMLQTMRTKNSATERCDCPVGFYDDVKAEDIVCHACHSSCITCEGPRAHDCLTCGPGKELDSLGFCVCSKGFSEAIDGSCACFPPKVLFQGFCTSTDTNCGPNQVAQLVDLTGRCICKKGFIQVLNDCIKCEGNSVFDNDELKCKCINQTILVNGTCIGCGVNQIYDEVRQICRCSGSTFKADDGSCISCPTKMAYINGKCECIFNYYFSSVEQKCRRCITQTDGPKCRKNYEVIDKQ